MICAYVGFSVLGAPRPIAVLLASLIASIISGDEDMIIMRRRRIMMMIAISLIFLL